MLFRDNLIIRLVLVYRSKENLGFNSSSIFLSDIKLSCIYLQLWKEYKHILRVFLRKQECQVTHFVRKTKVSSYKRCREEKLSRSLLKCII